MDIGNFWLSNKKFEDINMISLAAVWCLRKLMNDHCLFSERRLEKYTWTIWEDSTNDQELCDLMLNRTCSETLTDYREAAGRNNMTWEDQWISSGKHKEGAETPADNKRVDGRRCHLEKCRSS